METTKLILWLTVLGLIILGLVGWVLNAIAFVHMLGSEITTLFIARALGLVIPFLGSVLGFF